MACRPCPAGCLLQSNDKSASTVHEARSHAICHLPGSDRKIFARQRAGRAGGSTLQKSGLSPGRRSPLCSFIRADAYFFRIAIVSEAIISSSSVGITTTFTFESSVEITASSPRTLFFSASSFTPMNSSPSQAPQRAVAWFSPTPPVKTMMSTPPSAAA